MSGILSFSRESHLRMCVSRDASPVELQAFEVAASDKADALRSLLHLEPGRTLVLVRTKRGAERLAKSLARDGFAAAMIHGDRSQAQRTGALNGLEQGRFRVLVATDVASRGLHIQDVAHVINYDPSFPRTSFIAWAALAGLEHAGAPPAWYLARIPLNCEASNVLLNCASSGSA